jgi:hypothetical protein
MKSTYKIATKALTPLGLHISILIIPALSFAEDLAPTSLPVGSILQLSGKDTQTSKSGEELLIPFNRKLVVGSGSKLLLKSYLSENGYDPVDFKYLKTGAETAKITYIRIIDIPEFGVDAVENWTININFTKENEGSISNSAELRTTFEGETDEGTVVGTGVFSMSFPDTSRIEIKPSGSDSDLFGFDGSLEDGTLMWDDIHETPYGKADLIVTNKDVNTPLIVTAKCSVPWLNVSSPESPNPAQSTTINLDSANNPSGKSTIFTFHVNIEELEIGFGEHRASLSISHDDEEYHIPVVYRYGQSVTLKVTGKDTNKPIPMAEVKIFRPDLILLDPNDVGGVFSNDQGIVTFFASMQGDYKYKVEADNHASEVFLGFLGSRTGIWTQPQLRSLSFGEVLDQPRRVFITSEPGNWVSQMQVARDNTGSIASGKIEHGNQAWIETIVTGPGELSFWWKSSSEADNDLLEFVSNETAIRHISGEVDWKNENIFIPAGTQILRWRYSKNHEIIAGKDKCWVDSITWTPEDSNNNIIDHVLMFARSAGVSGDEARPEGTPHQDGVSNLLKYAFNMNANGPDSRILIPGSGLAGLPAIDLDSSLLGRSSPRLRVEYLRRRNSGIIYTAEFCSTLANTGVGSWEPATGVPEIIPVNDIWERVVVLDQPSALASTRFGRVIVEIPTTGN